MNTSPYYTEQLLIFRSLSQRTLLDHFVTDWLTLSVAISLFPNNFDFFVFSLRFRPQGKKSIFKFFWHLAIFLISQFYVFFSFHMARNKKQKYFFGLKNCWETNVRIKLLKDELEFDIGLFNMSLMQRRLNKQSSVSPINPLYVTCELPHHQTWLSCAVLLMLDFVGLIM